VPVNALEPIVAATREEVRRRKLQTTPAQLERLAAQRLSAGDRRPFIDAIAGPGLAVIAEHKRRSPSAGLIRAGVALGDVIGAYERGGASAVSVLTEGPSFGGSLGDLRAARAAAQLPILRKDFIVERYQVLESVAAGADAILLIVAVLTPSELAGLQREADAWALAALVEVHDRAELELAAASGARLIGINNRDLTTLDVDRRRTLELLPHLPSNTPVVAESGFRARAELDELERAGVSAVLVGEALMRAADVEAACRELTGTRV